MTAAKTRLKNISAQKNSRPPAASIEELMSAKAKNITEIFLQKKPAQGNVKSGRTCINSQKSRRTG